MKKQKIDQLISILISSQSYISSTTLAKMIGVSEKTIRNYIKEINQGGDYQVESSSAGYLIEDTQDSQMYDFDEIESRENYIFSRLLGSKDGISIFDLAEELHVSESTIINRSLPNIKSIAKKFSLKVTSSNYNYSLVGDEKNKRKLIGYIVTHSNNGYFTSTDNLEKLFPDSNIKYILKSLNQLCVDSNLFLNDYSLNNFLIHMIIIWIRIHSKNTISIGNKYKDLEKIVFYSYQKNEVTALSDQIAVLLENDYETPVSKVEYEQIITLITLSVDHSEAIFDSVLEPGFIDIVMDILDEISKRFAIPEFDHNFLMQFSLHMYNALQRTIFNLGYHNPITNQIKSDYAPIYDMAVYFAHKFSRQFSINISEDEISYIAFHLGSYIENNNSKKEMTTCIIIFEKYHNLQQSLVSQIRSTFQNSLMIIDIVSYKQYLKLQPPCDLLISTMQAPLTHKNMVFVNPIMTTQNIKKIWDQIETIEETKSLANARTFLRHLIKKDMYAKDIKMGSAQEYIEYIGDICCSKSYVSDEFTKDVLLRESVSSTAFNGSIAIPHTISQYAHRSFIYIIQNDSPVSWGERKVNFIFMIGIAQQDMRHFKDALNLLITIFSSPEKTAKILNTRSYEEFKNNLLNM